MMLVVSVGFLGCLSRSTKVEEHSFLQQWRGAGNEIKYIILLWDFLLGHIQEKWKLGMFSHLQRRVRADVS